MRYRDLLETFEMPLLTTPPRLRPVGVQTLLSGQVRFTRSFLETDILVGHRCRPPVRPACRGSA